MGGGGGGVGEEGWGLRTSPQAACDKEQSNQHKISNYSEIFLLSLSMKGTFLTLKFQMLSDLMEELAN